MADKLKAVVTYRPRLERSKAKEDRFLELLTQRTTLSNGVVKNVQESEVETLTGLLLDGSIVRTGTAIYIPSIGLDGRIKVSVRVDKRILAALNAEGNFRGEVTNAKNIGKTFAELIELWNTDNPGDPIA